VRAATSCVSSRPLNGSLSLYFGVTVKVLFGIIRNTGRKSPQTGDFSYHFVDSPNFEHFILLSCGPLTTWTSKTANSVQVYHVNRRVKIFYLF
jgi:hypothetical protein